RAHLGSGLIRAVADDLTLQLELGRLTVERDAIAEIVAETALACYGVVGLTAGTRMRRMLRREGISVEGAREGLRVVLHVVVERLSGLTVAAVEVVIQSVRQSG